MKFKHRLNEITKYLGKRALIWLGFRGTDAAVLQKIPQFSRVFSITAPLEANLAVVETCLEILQKRRVDLHTYTPDKDDSVEIRKLQKLLFAELNKPAAVLAYRPDKFFTNVYFPNAENVEYFGLFFARQLAFENKPWVESELRKIGVRTIPWKYYGLNNFPEVMELIKQGRIVVRIESSSVGGGGNMLIMRDENKISKLLNIDQNSLISISPYFQSSVSLNVNACLFQDGSISLHGPSLQLIGIKSCTNHDLGYCGNDFARIRDLDVSILNELEEMVVKVGRWLSGMGYLGVFGVDAIEYQGHAYFSEINPRFQNSSVIAAQLDRELDLPDLYLNQMAAFWGLSAPPYISLRELAKQQSRVSQIICYNQHPQPISCRDTLYMKKENADCTLLPAPDVEVVPEGMLFRLLVDGPVTVDGQSLLESYEKEISALKGLLFLKIF